MNIKIYSPLFIVLRIIIYGLLLYGMAQGIFFDAMHPVGKNYFSENTFTEITQEIILFVLFLFYLILGKKWKEISIISYFVSLFFLMTFIREFNFLIEEWIYPVLLVFALMVWLFIRDFKKIKQSCIRFFSIPASQWFMAGLITTLVFSRMFGRSKFWRLMYTEENYRMAKSAAEESVELLGDTLMLISASEFLLYYLFVKRSEK